MNGIRTYVAALALALPAAAIAAGPIVVHRDPGCGCCEAWSRQVKAQFGRAVRIVDDANRGAFQQTRAVPKDLGSCHTAIIDGMTFEGHVPIADIKRALATRPKGISGLAVPGMPMGSPGMEMPGMKSDAYDVIAFGPGGRRVFAHHQG
ncbi:DUF411 domain-containing protein [Sphingomonas sp.]|jgi:hypothetical protein|uniref:DUF411 domain-containing protein n=1 Tax=Sphingomonas sp. TaxID=28214 RepID=UPI002ED9C0F4